jgi:hypothetical protein
MRRSIVAFATVANIAFSVPLLAYNTQPEIPSPEKLGEMCNSEGGFRFRFGQTGVPFSSRLENDLGIGMELPTDLMVGCDV